MARVEWDVLMGEMLEKAGVANVTVVPQPQQPLKETPGTSLHCQEFHIRQDHCLDEMRNKIARAVGKFAPGREIMEATLCWHGSMMEVLETFDDERDSESYPPGHNPVLERFVLLYRTAVDTDEK